MNRPSKLRNDRNRNRNNSIKIGHNRRKPRSNISRRRKNIYLALKIIALVVLVGIIVVGGLVFGVVWGYYNGSTKLSDDQLMLTDFTSIVLDKNGKEIAQFSAETNREYIKLDKIPKSIQHAFIALEDERFYDHNGYDMMGTIRAIFMKITQNKTQGGSTITMQLIKNITEEKSQTIQRKIEEIVRARDLEKRWKNKDKILELYLNVVPLHGNVQGVQTGIYKYFGKDMLDGDEVTIAEAACISTITQRPAYYNPTTPDGHKNILVKQKLVLQKMLEQGYITEAEYNKAKNEEVKFMIGDENKKEEKQQDKGSEQTYFIDALVTKLAEDLSKKNNLTLSFAKTEIYSKGYTIKSTFDKKVQDAMDKVFQNEDKYFSDRNGGICKSTWENGVHFNKKYNLQAGMVIMDMNGYVRGIYGGKGKKEVAMGFNRATGAEGKPEMRNPGSTIKPIVVYGPALDMGTSTTATVLDDSPMYQTDEGKLIERPKNYSLDHLGLITLRKGVYTSNNVYAAKTWMELIDRDAALKYLDKEGFTENEFNGAKTSTRQTSIPLGQTMATNPLTMTGAYLPFANKGIYREPTFYTQLIDQKGKVVIDKLEGKDKQKEVRIYSEQATYLMHDVLIDVFAKGTAAGYRMKNSKGQYITTAGKTGTSENHKDYWIAGYTPYYVAVTWFGDDKSRPLTNNNSTPVTTHGERPDKKIWYDVMKEVHKDLEPKNFEKPSGITSRTVCKYSGLIPNSLCSKDKGGDAIINEIFSTDNVPRGTCNVHVEVKVCKEGSKGFPYLVRAKPGCPEDKVETFVLRDRTNVIQYVLDRKKSDIPNLAMLKSTVPWEDCPIHSDDPNESIFPSNFKTIIRPSLSPFETETEIIISIGKTPTPEVTSSPENSKGNRQNIDD